MISDLRLGLVPIHSNWLLALHGQVSLFYLILVFLNFDRLLKLFCYVVSRPQSWLDPLTLVASSKVIDFRLIQYNL